MRDPLSLAADAAALLGLTPREAPAADPGFRWPDYATLEELEGVVAEHRRLRRPETALVEVPDDWMRRARLRFELGLLVRGDDGLPHHLLRCLSRVEPRWLRAMSRCRCVERALCEVAREVGEVDAAVVVEVRARALVRHSRTVAALERRAERRAEWRLDERAREALAVRRGRDERLPNAPIAGADSSQGSEREQLVAVPAVDVAVRVRAGRSSVTAAGRRVDAAGDLSALSLRLTGRLPEKAPPKGVVAS